MNKEEKVAIERDDWLVFELNMPIDYQGHAMDKINLTKLKDMKLRDMNAIYESYIAMGGVASAMQESTLLFARLTAAWALDCTLEMLDEMGARDVIRLKNRIYRFFYLWG